VPPRPPFLLRRCNALLALAGGLLAGSLLCPAADLATPSAVSAPAAETKVTGAAEREGSPEAPLALRLAAATGRAVVTFSYAAGGLDLSTFRDLAVKVENRSAVELDILVTGVSNLADPFTHSAQTRFLVRPAEQADLCVFMTRPALPKNHPFIQRLGNLYAFPWGFQRHWRNVDAAAILRVTVQLDWSGAQPGQTVRISPPVGHGSFSVDPARLDSLALPVVDTFGQDTGQSWPGKVHRAEELAEDAARDLALVAATTGPAGARSRYGGDTRAPRRAATGFFRVEKIDGKWWFVDPEGHLFWSLGVNGAAGSSSTRVKGRESLFPAADRARAELNHYEENVKRKHGEAAWRRTHADVTVARLLDWGFNTVGAWSEPELLTARRVPYTLIAHPDLHGIGGIRKMVDPYAEGFRTSLDKVLAALAAEHADNPWLVGVFIENELEWKGDITLAEAVLGCDPRTPARRALIARLRERYPDLAALNQAWGTNHESFDALRPVSGPAATAAYGTDLRDYLGAFADTFFAACAAAMDKHFPHHLYLGCRFHVWNPLVTAAATRHCDVISVNAYRYGLADFSLTTSEDKPYLVSEFHFGTRDFGAWGAGLAWAADARNQSDLVRAYVSDALRHPNIIGAHWFQWSGQAVTGRYDGENFGVGLVTIVDRPVDPLVKAFAEVSAGLYDYRRAPSTTRIGAPTPPRPAP
jgi:hypothetical protein